jgi:uncharacterized protein with HEPN domain
VSDDRDQRYVRYVLECIDRIQHYVPATFDEFVADGKAQDAVLWRLQTLADVVKSRLSDGLKARHPTIRWRAIAGFRNIAAHDYVTLNMVAVWEIVSDHLEPLREVLEREILR